MYEPITSEEKQQLRDILSRFYGATSQHWTITPRSFELLGELIEKTKACDAVMDLIPRPYRGGNVIKWASKQVRKVVLRKLKDSSGKHYIACMRAAALSKRSAFEMAQYQ